MSKSVTECCSESGRELRSKSTARISSSRRRATSWAWSRRLRRARLREGGNHGGKGIRFHSDARERMLRGIDVLSNAVRVTLGPKGRNVVLDKSYGAPRISKDGVTVAKEIELADKFENMGAQMVREVAS